MYPSTAARQSVPLSRIRLDDVDDHVPLDELALLARRLSQRSGGEAIEVAHRAGGGLVEADDGVGGEHLARAAGTGHPHAEGLGGVVWRQREDLEAMVNT